MDLKEARRKVVTVVWLFGPWAVALPFLAALKLWSRIRGTDKRRVSELPQPADRHPGE